MGMLPARMCSKCHRTAAPGSRYCAAHAAQPETRHPRGPLKRMYDCVKWRVYTRNAVLFRDPRCTGLINSERCWALATDCHHVVDADEWVARGGDFYDLDNIVGLCKACHTAVRRGRGAGGA